MRVAAQRVRLPFRNRTWRGEGGNWQGAGVGSSIDFQDHRPYLPGDDPRYIDWQAYARTGHYSMKLYREEVSPRVDVALDVSASMFFDDAKRQRALELFFFCAESALQAGSSLRCHAVEPGGQRAVAAGRGVARSANGRETRPRPAIPHAAPPPRPSRGSPGGRDRCAWSYPTCSFPGHPSRTSRCWPRAKGRGLVFAPFCRAEAGAGLARQRRADRLRNAARRRAQHVDADLLARYRPQLRAALRGLEGTRAPVRGRHGARRRPKRISTTPLRADALPAAGRSS